MSYILDALRKSESERQQGSAATLSRAPLAAVRQRIPVWTWLVIGCLSIALIALGALWWRGNFDAMPPTTADDAPGVPAEIPGIGSRAPSGQAEPAAASSRLRPIGELASFDPSLPEYRLEVLACCGPDAAENSAWINGRRYFPGERIGNGPVVVDVRADGVVLAFGGERFLLTTRN